MNKIYIIFLILILILIFSNKKEKMTNTKKIIQTLYRVAPSNISGAGLIAIADIPKNTKILYNRPIPTGSFYSDKELEELNLNKDFIRLMQDYWCMHNDKTFIPDNPNIINPVNFINHSSNPNIKKIDSHFITLKDIKKGEELLEDYNDICSGNHILFKSN